MTLRARMLLALVPLGIAVCAVSVLGVRTVGVLGRSSQRILAANYRSILAAERMRQSIDALDRVRLLRSAGRPADADSLVQAAAHTLEAELSLQENNITEPGERAVTGELRLAWSSYQRGVRSLDSLRAADAPPPRLRQVETALDGSVRAILRANDRVLAVNQDAMVRKSEDARRLAQRMNRLLALVALGAGGLGVCASAYLTARVLRPVDALTTAVHRIREGDLSARAPVTGGDEIGLLAREFNAMAEHLEEYRASSLGELLHAQQAAQATVDSLQDPVVVFEADGGILVANRASELLLGISAGTPGRDSLAHLEPAVRAVVQKARDHVLAGKGAVTPRGFEEAVTLATADGDRWFLPRAQPLYDGRGLAGVTVILQDVTRLRRFDDLRNDLVAAVAHEFRTPLTSLWMAIHLCTEEAAGPLTESQADLLHAARQDCARLQGIVDDLLDLARLQAGHAELHPQPLEPATLVAEATQAMERLATDASVALVREVEEALDAVAADPARARWVFTNLLANALRHAPSGSAIVVRARGAAGAVRFEVEDRGPGVDAAYHDKIFDRFFRVPGAAGSGAGLGLSIAKEIVEAHRGAIGVETPEGGGARFWFTLPVA